MIHYRFYAIILSLYFYNFIEILNLNTQIVSERKIFRALRDFFIRRHPLA